MATQAVFLDNNIAESYATLGMIAHTLEYDIALAELYLKKSLEINPNYASGNQWYALFLTSLAKFEEAFPYMEKALELDPNSAIINYAAGWMYYYATDFDKAINQIENTKMIDPNFPSDRLAFKCYFQIGQYQEVITLFENYLKDHNKFENYTSPESNRFTSEGIKSWIEYIIDYISDGPESLKWIIPMLYIHIGDTDEALNSLEYNVTNRVPHHINIGADPAYISLHSDPRFIDLAERIGFKFDN